MTRYIIIGAGAVGASLAAEFETHDIPYVLVGRGAQIAHIAAHGLSYRRPREPGWFSSMRSTPQRRPF